MKVNKWDKFYKLKDDNSVEILRLLRIKNSDCFVMTNEKKERIKLTEKELSEYTKLKPDGYINYSAVSLGHGTKDIIISLMRRKDIEDGNAIPYCICRQNIFDLFANNLARENGPQYAGCSVSVDTCPTNVDYKMMMACDSLIENINVSMYIDDTLEDLLYPVSLINFDDILKENFNVAIEAGKIAGYCNSVKQLLEQNYFMYDVLKGFNIYKVPFTATCIEGTTELCIEQREELEKMLKSEMFSTIMVPFSKEIDLKKIERDHVIISDSSNMIWIVLYDKGDYSDIEYKRSVRDIRDQIQDLKQ